MKRTILAGLTLTLALALLQAAPASAGAVYIPVFTPTGTAGDLHSTEIWVSNSATTQRGFAAVFLQAGTDGSGKSGTSPEVPVPPKRTFLLANPSNALGLLEVGSSQEMGITARMVNTSATGLQTISAVPVISSANRIEAKGIAHLAGLERDSTRGDTTHLGIVNLGQAATTCEVKFYRADGTQIGATVNLSFQPLSLRQFEDALGSLGEQRIADARAQVSCGQPFYAYAALLTQPAAQVTFIVPSALTAASTSGGGTTGGGNGNSVVFQKSGLLHTATTSNPKGYADIPITAAMAAKKMVIDMEFVPGPWNRSKIPGNHAIIWLYRGKFRGNTVANVNAFGPNKYTIKMNQNVDLGPGQVTAQEMGLQLTQGQRYHLHYVYNAATNLISTEISSGGKLLKSMTMAGTAQGGALAIEPPKLNVEFGHFPGQEGPEIPSYGWSYYDLRVEMIP
ncbi:MAG TPA: hypothetical protein VH394_30935 [Thermoanaerobaculia bacterium]|jgi:hypothetical protein|nr:hypothetical protein [Thermoanaerobaculia bacterium]